MAAPPLIKGYLPLRLQIPASYMGVGEGWSKKSDSKSTVDTFLFLKQHQGATDNAGCTFFVANAPILPRIPTPLFLKSIFGRYGDVARVTVVPNPRKSRGGGASSMHHATEPEVSTIWTSTFPLPSFLPQSSSREAGKFAHVVMKSPKDLKRTLQQLTKVMAGDRDDDHDDDEEGLPGFSLDLVELQTLADESDRQSKERQHSMKHDDDDESDEDPDSSTTLTGLAAVAQRYRTSRQPFVFTSSSSIHDHPLMEECNHVMQEWEEAQEEARQAREAAAHQPDEDGFVTVSYSNNTAALDDDQEPLDLNPAAQDNKKRRAKKAKRLRNQAKKQRGSGEFQDFYRFQTKEHRKKSIHELRERFEQDLRKVQQLKQEKQYRPF